MKNTLRMFARKFGTMTSLLIFATPIFMIMFLGGMMARGQVKGEFAPYQAIREFTSLSALKAAQPNDVVMLRGQIVNGPSPAYADGLIVFQERPLNGRELRFQEEFPLVFPEITLALSDGTVVVVPSEGRVISHESQRVIDPTRDREYTGFRLGDPVTIQGKWHVPAEGSLPQLQEATGITSLDRAAILAEGQYALDRLDTICIVLGVLTVLPLMLMLVQMLRLRLKPKALDPVGV